MSQITHIADGSLLVAVAGVSFVVSYILGLFIAAKFDRAVLWPSIVLMFVCCLVRAVSEPLGFAAIAAVSVLHINIACLTVLILRNTKPLNSNPNS